MAIKVVINNIDRTDLIAYSSAAQWNLMRGSRGTCALPFIIPPGETFAPQVGHSVEIFDPVATRVWAGSIDTAAIRWSGDEGWHIVTVTGVSLDQLFDTAELDKVKYAGVTAGAAFADIVSRSGITAVTLGTVDAGPTVESLEVTNIAQGFDSLALIAGFVWYIDPADKKLYFHAPAARAAAWTVVSNDVLWETADWKQSRADYRNEQVLQLPGVSRSPVTATFAGDGTTTDFNLATVPEYVLTIDLTIGRTDKTIHWTPGTTLVTCHPAPQIGSTLIVRYADSGVVVQSAPGVGIGDKTARYTQTRSFTPAGGLQEAAAMLARYSMLPAQLTFSTDKPGIGIGRKLTIALDRPLESGALLNGDWMVQEVEGFIIPGLEKRNEPWGHFRYTIHLINTAATAIFQGDGETGTYILPIVPSAVISIRIDPKIDGQIATWVIHSDQVTVTPPLDAGQGMAVDYVDPNHAPDVPTFPDTWNSMGGGFGGAQPALASGDKEDHGGPETFKRDFTIYDSAVRDDAAPHTTVYRIGIGWRILAVLRKAITADLTVKIHKAGVELLTVTIPAATGVDTVLEWPLQQGSPALYVPFFDKEVLTADILESDASTDKDGVAQFTVQWAVSGAWQDFGV